MSVPRKTVLHRFLCIIVIVGPIFLLHIPSGTLKIVYQYLLGAYGSFSVLFILKYNFAALLINGSFVKNNVPNFFLIILFLNLF